MATLYRIKDWDKHFENAQSRKVTRLAYVLVPNKHDGDGYTELVCDHPNGPAHYGAWVATIQVGAKCEPRGSLMKDTGIPHDATSLSRKTRLPSELFTEAFPRLLQIGWLEALTVELPDGYQSSGSEVGKNRTELNRTELNTKSVCAPEDQEENPSSFQEKTPPLAHTLIEWDRVTFPPSFNRTDVREALEGWLAQRRQHGKFDLDTALAVTSALQLFPTPAALCQSWTIAQANGWDMFKDYTDGEEATETDAANLLTNWEARG